MLTHRKIRPIDIAPALAALADAEFRNSGGTNGWLADPDLLLPFVKRLGLGVVVNVNLRKLPAGQGIPPHIDPKFLSDKVIERRFHIPLVTHPDVTMHWPDDHVEVHLEAGWLYEVDHHRLHEVIHRATVDRIHIAVDTAEARP